jgi:hypothetical protein
LEFQEVLWRAFCETKGQQIAGQGAIPLLRNGSFRRTQLVCTFSGLTLAFSQEPRVRYLKGSVSLRDRDRELLHLVADARYMTHGQLFQMARLKALEFERPIFNWRVRRLVNSGLLRKQVVPYLGADALYSITRGGVQALEEMGITYLGGYGEREKDPTEAQVPHVLELNRIRLALERSRALMVWIPEVFIRVVNLSPTLCYAKAYDAVAKVSLGGGVWAEFAIEYERTLKSEQKYEKIVEAIESERRLHTILYLTPSYELLASLRWYFERARHDVLFALVEDFKKDVLDTQVDLARAFRRMTLRDALARSTSQVKASVFG